jgi:hypothetical protein
MRVLPRYLPVGIPKMPFSGYQGLISRSPARRADSSASGEVDEPE